jgi:hypothetical protein
MQFDLIRKNTGSDYIYGTLFNDNGFVADSLEIPSDLLLPVGQYLLCIDKSAEDGKQFISIRTLGNKEISRFVQNNTYFLGNILCRKENNFISLGLKTLLPLLVMNEYIYTKTLQSIKSAIFCNEQIILNVRQRF